MAFKTSLELEDLQDKLVELEARKAEYFGDDEIFESDRDYQNILEQISNTTDKILEIEEDFRNAPDMIDPEIFDHLEFMNDNPYYDNAEDYEIDFGD